MVHPVIHLLVQKYLNRFQIVLTILNFFLTLSNIFNHKSEIYLINWHIWDWSKNFEHLQKILDIIKKIWMQFPMDFLSSFVQISITLWSLGKFYVHNHQCSRNRTNSKNRGVGQATYTKQLIHSMSILILVLKNLSYVLKPGFSGSKFIKSIFM